MFKAWLADFLTYLKKMGIFIIAVAVGSVLFQYLTCPVYRFSPPHPFSGGTYFNPYDGVDSTSWRRANFQVQSYAWGGMTDGRKNSNELIDSVYRLLGYDIVATSDYQKINRFGEEKEGFIPVYEHGYGWFKRHQVLLGARGITWADFPFFQDLHHKQHILNKLRGRNELVYIAHPALRGGYKPQDMKYLSGYDGLEVLNYQTISEAHWDTALSAGRYVTIMANDDAHDVTHTQEVGHLCTYIWSPSMRGDSIISALKHGRAYGAEIYRPENEDLETKAKKVGEIAELHFLRMKGDTLFAGFGAVAREVRFIGQGGRLCASTANSATASYVFSPRDTYIRVEALFPDRNLLYLNPVVRCDGTAPDNPPAATVDLARSVVHWIISWATVLFLGINVYFLRKRWKKNPWNIRKYLAENRYRKYLLILVLVSFAVRAFLAAVLELGNDEVYYWTYALFPDLGHFDHPPMVGWMIQLFTLDLTFQDEFFLRLPGLVLGSLSTLLVYGIAKRLRDELTGWYAALLFTASIYCFVLSGTFILPDTPQLFFWLAAIRFFLPALTGPPAQKGAGILILLAGLMTGLAMLSKYTSVFLWAGALAYILFRNRPWLRSGSLYLSMLLSALVFLPVLIWNVQNGFISFTFQGSRAGFFQGGLRPDYFLTELGGEILYNNPVVVLLSLLAVISFFKGKMKAEMKGPGWLLLAWSLPLIGIFLLLSLFRPTLPHWTGPAYATLIFLGAAWLRNRQATSARLLPPPLSAALILTLLAAALGVLQVNYGLFYTGKEQDITRRGRNDVSMDLYGWDQVSAQFRWLANDDRLNGYMQEDAPIVTFRWFPAANIDYYVARYAGKEVLALGTIESIHKYHWINRERKGLEKGMDAYFITTSRDYKDPHELYGDLFAEIEIPYHFPILRGGKVAGYGFIFKMKDYRKDTP